MANIYPDNSQTIGKTPLVQMNRILGPEAKATILAKIEGRNPAYSVKCRIGAGMIWDAESKGLLGPGKEIVEPTSGNTGIALAFVSAARNYPITLCMPESMSLERRKVLAALGAHLVLTPAGEGMAGAVRRAEANGGKIPTAILCCNSSRIRPTPRSIERRPALKFGRIPMDRWMSWYRASEPAEH